MYNPIVVGDQIITDTHAVATVEGIEFVGDDVEDIYILHLDNGDSIPLEQVTMWLQKV